MSFIQQNVGKMEPSVENVDDRKDDWLYWGSQADVNDRKCKCWTRVYVGAEVG